MSIHTSFSKRAFVIARAGLAIALLLIVFLTGNELTAYGDALPIYEYSELGTAKGKPAYVPDQLIVEFTPATELRLQSQVLASFGLRPLEQMDDTSFVLVQLPSDQKPLELVRELLQHPSVASAEPNYYQHAFFTPNDEYYSYQWHFPIIQMPTAWDQSTGSNVIVAVLDTGAAYEDYDSYKLAPDLAGTTFVAGYDFINDDSHPNDDQSHGTHVTGTIAQTTNNNIGVTGIAYNAKIMPVKVLDSNGTGSVWHIAEGIRWATDNGAQVINMSLGGASDSSVQHEAIQYAYSNGVTIVAAAGNDGTASVGYPAAYDEVIAVGAVRYDETRASYSQYGAALDLVAPGGDTSVDQNGDGYGDGVLQQTLNPSTKNPSSFAYYFFQGTSMASPHVAGAAAVLIAKGVATTPDEVREALQSTAKDLGNPGRDDEYGYGLIQLADALAWNGGTPTTPTTTPTPSPTPNGPTPTATATTVPTATPTPIDDWEARTVQLINNERAERGLAALTSHPLLADAARGHSQDMADNDFFSHYGSDGSSPFDRIQAVGYSFKTAGETIAGGYTSPESAVNAWMNSSGHRAILLGNFTEVGVGYVYESSSTYRHYWTADFAVPSSSNPTATPTTMPTSTPTDLPADDPSPTPTFTNTPITTPTATMTPIPAQGCADLDGDGTVGMGDLQRGAADWHSVGTSEADLNGDDKVNVVDLMMIAKQWATSCTRN